MNSLIIYSIEITISLALFYSAYWLFLKNETFFKLNRLYLVSSAVISLTAPLLNITLAANGAEDSFIAKYFVLPIEQYEQSLIVNFDKENAPVNNTTGSRENKANMASGKVISDNELTKATPDPAQSVPSNSPGVDTGKKINWLTIALIIYCIGAALLLIRFLANFTWIIVHALRSKPRQMFGMKVIRLEKNISPFSFLNLIFIGSKEYPEAELIKIISHEKVHMQQKHVIDLILFELLLVFQWFNPIVWFYKRTVKITHEYLADQGTLNSGIDPAGYQYSLLNQVLRQNNIEIASNYNLSVKKRIEMMLKKRSSKLSALKLIIALPILVFLFSAFAFNTGSSGKNPRTLLRDENNCKDSLIKKVNVPVGYLKQLEGEYISTNEPGRERRIIFTELLGTLYGNDNGYIYKVIPVGDEKFINPDDGASLIFNSKDKNAMSLSLFGKINLNKRKIEKGSAGAYNRSMGFTLANVMLTNGIPAGISYYKAAKDSSNYFIMEHEMNYAGYQLLQSGKTAEASAMVKLLTEIFPNSFNVYDSYAEALLILGDKIQAIENFKKSVELNPGSKNGIKRLQELGVNTDELVKKFNVAVESLKLLEGNYISTNQPNWMRLITFTVEEGTLVGNDNGYRYKLWPVGEGKFINPDDGASLVFDTKNKNAITLSLFGKINLKKVEKPNWPDVKIKEYAGVYLPSKKDTILKTMELRFDDGKLYRFIEAEAHTPNGKVELQFVSDNLVFYSDNSRRSIEFILNDRKEITACILRRPDGTYKLVKQK